MLNHSKRNRRISRFTANQIGQLLFHQRARGFIFFAPPRPTLTPSLLLVRSFLSPSSTPVSSCLLRLFADRTTPLVLLPPSPSIAPLYPCPIDRGQARWTGWLEQVETKVRCLHLYYNPLFPCLVLMHRIHQATWPAAHRSSLASFP